MTPAARRGWLIFAAVAAALAVLVFALYAAAEGDGAARARRVLTFAVMLEALAALLAAVFVRQVRQVGQVGQTLRRAGAVFAAPLLVFAAALPGEALLSLSLDRGAFGALVLAKLAALSAGLAAAALALALGQLLRRPLVAAALAGALALGFALQPFYVRPAISALGRSGRAAARDRLIACSLRSPPMAAAYALAGARPVGWEFVPHRSGWFYNHWLGTDFQISVPGPGRYIGEYCLAAALLGVVGILGALRRKPPTAPPG